jgi:heme-degrading monooxygenase HmoA
MADVMRADVMWITVIEWRGFLMSYERSRCAKLAARPCVMGLSIRRMHAMSDITKRNDICTQITTVKLPPGKQDEVLDLMIERARFMATQPGFVSVNLHRSKDGSHVVNYVQWTNSEKLAAAHHSPEFRKQWPHFGELVSEADPSLYDVVHVEAA